MHKKAQQTVLIVSRGLMMSLVEFINSIKETTRPAPALVPIEGRAVPCPRESCPEKAQQDSSFVYLWDKRD
jgi:hypothetical protein